MWQDFSRASSVLMNFQSDLLEPLLTHAAALPRWAYVFGAVIVSYLSVRVMWRWREGAEDRALKRRQRRAEQAEVDAAGVLRAHGYHIISGQAEHHWSVGMNGSPHEIELRADYLVSRRGRRYVAEVKSGHAAPSIDTSATRRQLLEYLVAYPVDGVLLVDMQDVEIYEVDFGPRIDGRSSRGAWLKGILLGAMLGAFGVYIGRQTWPWW